MTASLKMFGTMIRQISHEAMMAMLVISPFAVGVIFKFGCPLFESKILDRFGYGDVLVPYYDLFSWLLAMLVGMMFAFVGGLVVLGEIDEGITKYILVTPPGEAGYLFSRIICPAIVSGIVTAVILPVFALTHLTISEIAVMTVSTVLCGFVTALLVVTVSSNKVEGMAVGKLSGLFGVTFFVPLLLKGSIRYLFTVFPMYHIGVWSRGGSVLSLVAAAVLFAVWITVLYRLFRRKFI